MLRWFRPRCPLDPGTKQWTEDRLGWLLGQFGKEKLLRSTFVVPTRDLFPDHYDGSEAAARALFHRTCEFMEIDAARLELKFYQQVHRPGLTRSIVRSRLDWVGLYERGKERNVIRVDVATLPQPETLLGTFAHELAHEILLGSQRIPEDDPDHELVTDLTTVFFGMGVFNANDSLVNHYRVNRRGEEIGSVGYLTPATWGYALALCAWLRKEKEPDWAAWLHPPMSRTFRQSASFLWSGDAEIVLKGDLDVERRIPLLAIEYPRIALHDKDSPDDVDSPHSVLNQNKLDPEDLDERTEASNNGVDLVEQLMIALELMEEAEWEQACQCLNEVIRLEPENGTAFQQRALVLLELGRFTEALQDAEVAVREDPDDPESYRARGAARLKVQRFQEAIADLSRYLHDADVYSANGVSASRGFYLRGLSYAGLGQFQNAIRDYDRAIQRWPGWPEPYEARADAYQAIGNMKRANADRDEGRRRAAP